MGFSSGSRTSSITFSKQGKNALSLLLLPLSKQSSCVVSVCHTASTTWDWSTLQPLCLQNTNLWFWQYFFQSLAGWDTLSLRVIIKAHIVQQAPSQMGGNSCGVQNVEGVTPHRCCCYPWDVEQGVAGPFGKASHLWGDIDIGLIFCPYQLHWFSFRARNLFIHRSLCIAFMAGVLVLPMGKFEHIGIEFCISLDGPDTCPVVSFCQGLPSQFSKKSFCQGLPPWILFGVHAFCQGIKWPSHPSINGLPGIR